MGKKDTSKNTLFYGDNLDILRKRIKDESVDLCYIDPPFNSKRTYNQIYLNIGEDKAQAQAFVDTWKWDNHAAQGYQEIISNFQGRFTKQTIELMKGLCNVLGNDSSLLAYLVSMTLRITEIQRVLKPTGSFYLHCDPTCSHYLKLILDAVFCPKGGDYKNEIVWCYKERELSRKHFNKKHDVIFFYTKSNNYSFNPDLLLEKYSDGTIKKFNYTDETGRKFQIRGKGGIYTGKQGLKIDLETTHPELVYRDYLDKSGGILPRDWWEIPFINRAAKERLGYPTQKPEALLERIIKASSNKGDTVLDAYCGCGTTIAVAQNLKRKWIGIDITYQSISVILRRFEDTFGKKISDSIILDGIPKDIESARALANKKDDRLRKEFEKWAILTYSDNRAMINEKKGADKGIDGLAYFWASQTDTEKIAFQVKSGTVGRKDIATFRSDTDDEKAQMGIFLTLEEPTDDMRKAAMAAGMYEHKLMGRPYNKIQIVTVREIIEEKKRLEMPLEGREVLKSAKLKSGQIQEKI